MPFLVEDSWINSQANTHEIAELEDCSIAVDASYYLSLLLDTEPAHEPLLPALGGLTGIQVHIRQNLDLWDKFGITPFFIFNGQSIVGQDEVTLRRGRAANQKTDEAWGLYSQTEAEQAVAAFGANPGAFLIQNLYPLLQSILKERGLHFLVPPYNACAQLAYFEMINSDQCAGVMGPQELLLYPIQDSVIRNIDFMAGTVTAISKKKVMRVLGVSEPMFVDAMLMTGTSFLAPFPPLQDTAMYPNPFTIMDAVNILRTSEKAVANACASFNDILQAQDPNWLDKYRKARMAAHHFIYISESGEVKVNDFDRLTKDNHEYLGLQMPAELFHYLNTGLIGARILNSITHGQIIVFPTLDGNASDEYKKLVTSQILPIKEQTFGLVIPRVHRGIGHKDITMKVWFDPKYSYTLNHRSAQPPPSQIVGTWDVKEQDLRRFFPADFAGPIYLEVLALAKQDFVEKTICRGKPIRGIDSTDMVVSVAIWRFLHLRGYVDDSHKLTNWGNALATTLLAIRDAMEETVPGIDEAALLAFELLRFGLLSGKYREGAPGMPRKGTDEDKASVILISQCASLLRLRHQVFGYTGPLNKSLLGFRALSTTVREADRDLIEAIVASMFMYGQCQRDRNDQLDISQRLPFSQEPHIGLGIAALTFFDEDDAEDSKEARAARLQTFPSTFVPLSEALPEDLRIAVDFVSALNQGVQTLDVSSLPAKEKAAWTKAQDYINARPF
ncbi:PIN domain-like protein [Trichoderma longibrachiatum ATCC 18648]|uniref:PIN domain-like protein n=1 Tax=Trichoderma longibrachiatum ATCC 18648 TaxID=983965 RepID=A0A2T4CAQ7_TRILO|nr:PIN domain-like protein [Trichoderma longibrachiatum ATCC 18648]